jgi:hypothetical protein
VHVGSRWLAEYADLRLEQMIGGRINPENVSLIRWAFDTTPEHVREPVCASAFRVAM